MFAALHSWSFRDAFQEDPAFDIFRCIDRTADMGFTGIEIMSGKAGAPAEHLGSADPAHLEKVMKHARARGVKVLSLATYNDFAFTPNEAWRKENIAYVKEWLGIAGSLGVPNIRMLTGYYNDITPRDELERLTREGIMECIPHAEKAGVNMAVENHNTIFMQADEIVVLIDECGSDRLTTCPDPSNWGGNDFWNADCPGDVKELVLTSAAKLAPKATQSHLKIKGAPVDGMLAGFGDGLARLLQSYKDAGYDGGIAFESIGEGDLLEPMVAAREVLEKAITELK